jgi:hypothetical protein
MIPIKSLWMIFAGAYAIVMMTAGSGSISAVSKLISPGLCKFTKAVEAPISINTPIFILQVGEAHEHAIAPAEDRERFH